jgi:hypothetical protein
MCTDDASIVFVDEIVTLVNQKIDFSTSMTNSAVALFAEIAYLYHVAIDTFFQWRWCSLVSEVFFRLVQNTQWIDQMTLVTERCAAQIAFVATS